MSVHVQPGPLALEPAREAPPWAVIFNVMRFALHDGPGIRTTVFFKGCPLECHWCHNPESRSARIDVMYFPERCRLCGDCVAACPHGALRIAEARIEQADDCHFCGTCAEACRAGAREGAGRRVLLAGLLAEIERDVVFYDESGGGVTFSGGEPLAQAAFVEALALECRRRRIRTALDTCGFAPAEVMLRVAAAVDLVLYDLKLADPDLHRRYTGVSNELILANLGRLAAAGRPLLVRVPLIPGVNDGDAELAAMRGLLANFGVRQVDLLPYNRIGRDKYARLGIACPLAVVEPPSEARMQEVAGRFRREGFEVTIGGKR
jgi:pyruvate formate lyase activating enzyme